jgi:hypothetical protein
MKNTLINLMLATAAVMVASTLASAQSLNAEIPFSFRAANTLMSPGTYEVISFNGGSYFELRNQDARQSILLATGVRQDPPKAWSQSGSPALQFTCSDEGCALNLLWTGIAGNPAHAYARPKAEQGKSGKLAIIRMAVKK